jgi:hypothetical protein
MRKWGSSDGAGKRTLRAEYGMPLLGIGVAIIMVVTGLLVGPVYATGCGGGPCTYHSGGKGYGGACGTGTDLSCVCTYNGQAQGQTACKATQ